MHSTSDCIWSTITNNHLSNHPSSHQPSTPRTTRGSASPESTDPTRGPHDYSGSHQTTFPTRPDWMSGYAQMVTDRVRAGWSCYLVTFLFDQLPGSRAA